MTTESESASSRQRPLGLASYATAILLAPALGLISIFILIPSILAVLGSLESYTIVSSNRTFVGLGNYAIVAADPTFWVALKNNLIIVVGSVVTQIGFGTILAAILDRGLPRGSVVFRTIIFAPVVVSPVAIALLWVLILEPNIGALGSLLRIVGLGPPALGWLGDPAISIWAILGMATWQYTGFVMVVILAGLQGIPKELYEAAALDGARGLKAFWHVTLPSIRNVLVVVGLFTTVGGFKVFDVVWAATKGGPANATQVLGTLIYKKAFVLQDVGYANAVSVVLLLITFVLGATQLYLTRRV